MKNEKSLFDQNMERMFPSDCPFDDDDDTAAEEAHRQTTAEKEESEWIENNRSRKATSKPEPKMEVSEEMAYCKDDRPATEKLSSKLKAAQNAAVGSGLRYNMVRAAVGAARKLGHDLEMPKNDDVETLILTLSSIVKL